ncbi:peptide chain release factor N(5)-glutamine methyltransferase [bacterium]|nr:peptide chain release factor N(5)-glutamine methyltransferase [bacterium]
MKDLWTVRALTNWTTSYFAEKGIVSPRLDAELLLAHALQCLRLDLYLTPDKPVNDRERTKFRGFVKRRAKREPVAYILGKKEFWSRDFLVNSKVLIPRPETEHLIEVVLEIVKSIEKPFLADIGTGSGCIAITLALEIEDARIVAGDVSMEAIEIAKQNAERLNASETIYFGCGSWFDSFSGIAEEESFDIIVSNPPYIPEDKMLMLQPEIKYEPEKALNGGNTGLAAYYYLADQGFRWLRPGGSIVLETGDNQSNTVSTILSEHQFDSIAVVQDATGKDRIVTGRKPCKN